MKCKVWVKWQSNPIQKSIPAMNTVIPISQKQRQNLGLKDRKCIYNKCYVISSGLGIY